MAAALQGELPLQMVETRFFRAEPASARAVPKLLRRSLCLVRFTKPRLGECEIEERFLVGEGLLRLRSEAG